MSSYRSEYEGYYRNITSKPPAYRNIQKSVELNSIVDGVVKKVVRQLLGSALLLLVLIVSKYLPNNQFNQIYLYSKDAVNYNLNIDELEMKVYLSEIDEYVKMLYDEL
jgi:hypothetical protein